MVKEFRCTFEGCDRTYPKAWRLEEHMCTHTGIRPFTCSEADCGKTFIRAAHLKRHMTTHTGDRPFACTHPECGMTFATSTHLKRHSLVHEKDLPYACTHTGCTASFAKHLQLRKHQFVHTGVHAYPCTHDGCERSFVSQSKLERHLVAHSGAPLYLCGQPSCGAGFPTWTLLQFHMKEEHRGDHRCHACGKVFGEARLLKQHTVIHRPDRPKFTCSTDQCTQAFTTRRALRHHVASYHDTKKARHLAMRKARGEYLEAEQEVMTGANAIAAGISGIEPADAVRLAQAEELEGEGMRDSPDFADEILNDHVRNNDLYQVRVPGFLTRSTLL